MRRIPTALLAPPLLVAACTDPTATAPADAASARAPRVAAAAAARVIYGLTASVGGTHRLIAFSSAAPAGALLSDVAVGPLATPTERLVGIDFRPNDQNPGDGVDGAGALYAVSTARRLYRIEPATGAATPIAQLSPAAGQPVPVLAGNFAGVDFNPVPDRLRVHGEGESNLRIVPDDGATLTDGPLAFLAGDANAGANPTIVGTAYTNSDADPATGTTLYAIDAGRDVLVRLDAPNAGMLRTVGPLGVNTNVNVGFDVAGADNAAFATLTVPGTRSALYTVNLATGRATLVGTVARTPAPLIGIAVPPAPVASADARR